jgi:hypothetical protein
MWLRNTLGLCLVLCTLVVGEKARYDNYRVITISIENEAQLAAMRQIEEYPDGVSMTTSSQRRSQDVFLFNHSTVQLLGRDHSSRYASQPGGAPTQVR